MTRYRLAIRSHLAPKLAHHRVDRLQPEHLEVAYLELVAGGLAASTVLYAHRVLSQALSVAVRRGTLARNVASLVDPPRGRLAESEPLSLTDARAILAACEGERNSARWSVGLALGLRQGEALGLSWGRSVNLEAGNLVVGQALQRIAYRHACQTPCGKRAAACHTRELDMPIGFVVIRRPFGGLVFVEPKSDADKRTISMPPQLVEALRAHRQAQLEERLLAGSEWEDHDLVFAQPNGRPIDPRRDWGAWKSLGASAGVRASASTTPDTRPRRSCSCRASARGSSWTSWAGPTSGCCCATSTSWTNSVATPPSGWAALSGVRWPPRWHHQTPPYGSGESETAGQAWSRLSESNR